MQSSRFHSLAHKCDILWSFRWYSGWCRQMVRLMLSLFGFDWCLWTSCLVLLHPYLSAKLRECHRLYGLQPNTRLPSRLLRSTMFSYRLRYSHPLSELTSVRWSLYNQTNSFLPLLSRYFTSSSLTPEVWPWTIIICYDALSNSLASRQKHLRISWEWATISIFRYQIANESKPRYLF